MSKLLNRVLRLEDRLDDRDRIRATEMNIMRLEERVNALARHLGIKFETTSVVAVKEEET